MNTRDLCDGLLNEIHSFDGVTSIILKDLDSGTILFQFAPEYVMPASGMDKLSILLAVMRNIEAGKMRLDNCVIVPDLWISKDTVAFERGSMSYSIGELLNWMIISDESTPANVFIELLGYKQINDCCREFGMAHTEVKCRLGETQIAQDGNYNATCAQDALVLFEKLYFNRGMSRELCEYSGRMFLRNRSNAGFNRYICDDIYLGSISGEGSNVSHEAGIFYLRQADYFLSVFTTGSEGIGEKSQKMRGRIADMVYNYYLEREDRRRAY